MVLTPEYAIHSAPLWPEIVWLNFIDIQESVGLPGSGTLERLNVWTLVACKVLWVPLFKVFRTYHEVVPSLSHNGPAVLPSADIADHPRISGYPSRYCAHDVPQNLPNGLSGIIVVKAG